MDYLFSFEVQSGADEKNATLTFRRPRPLDGFLPPNIEGYINDFYKLFSTPQILVNASKDVYSQTFIGKYNVIATFSKDNDPSKLISLNIREKDAGVIFNLSGRSSINNFTPVAGSPTYDYNFHQNNNLVWKINNIRQIVNDGSAILYRGNDRVKNFNLPPNVDKVLQINEIQIVQRFNKLRGDSPQFPRVIDSYFYEINGIQVEIDVVFDLKNDQLGIQSYRIYTKAFSSNCRSKFETKTLRYVQAVNGYVLNLPTVNNQLINFRVNDASGRYSYNGYIVTAEVGNTVKSFLYNQSGNLAAPIVNVESKQASLIFKRPPGLGDTSLSARTKEIIIRDGGDEKFNLNNGRFETDKYVQLDGLTLAYIKAECQSFDCNEKYWEGYLLLSKSNQPNVVVDMIQTNGSGLELVPGRDQKSTFIRFKDSKSDKYYPIIDVDIGHCVLTI